MTPTRRRFLQSATSAAVLGLANVSAFRRLAAAETPPAAATVDMIRFGPDLEPIVRLIEETPREKCIPALVERLHHGLPYRHFLSAIFLAALRKTDSHHAVYKIHSAHQISLDLPADEMLLPLFWAVDGYKWQQQRFPSPPMAPFTGSLPSADQAIAAFHAAMKSFDEEGSQRAVVSLVRHLGLAVAMEQLWPYACRDVSVIGHRAISAANSCRVLNTIGAQQAENVLRFVVRDLYHRGGRQDQYYQRNIARVDQQLDQLPPGWASGKADPVATTELCALLRQGKSEEGCDLAAKQLAQGLGSQTVWDAVHVTSAELLILHRSSSGMSERPLHVNTTANALHHVFGVALAPRTRLLTLLQAVAWVADFMHVQLGEMNLHDGTLTNLEGAPLTASPSETVAEVFSALPPHTYTASGHNLHKPEDRFQASRTVYTLAKEHPESAGLFLRAARSWLAVKATVEAHEYKLPAALFEDYELVSPHWRPRLLAASVRWLHGKQSPESIAIQQARAAL